MGVSIQSSDGSAEDQDETISYDECFELLSNHRRRYTLHYLKQREDSVELGELAEQIAAWENDISAEDISYDQRKRVYTSLQQVHLPRMDDIRVVEFDDREGIIEIGPAAQELDIYMEVVGDHDVPWSGLYTGLSVLSLVVIGMAAAGVPVLAGLPGVSLALFVAVSFLVTSLAHLYITRSEMALGTGQDPPEL